MTEKQKQDLESIAGAIKSIQETLRKTSCELEFIRDYETLPKKVRAILDTTEIDVGKSFFDYHSSTEEASTPGAKFHEVEKELSLGWKPKSYVRHPRYPGQSFFIESIEHRGYHKYTATERIEGTGICIWPDDAKFHRRYQSLRSSREHLDSKIIYFKEAITFKESASSQKRKDRVLEFGGDFMKLVQDYISHVKQVQRQVKSGEWYKTETERE